MHLRAVYSPAGITLALSWIFFEILFAYHDFFSYLGKDSGTELEDSVFTPIRGALVQKSQYDDLMTEYLKLADAMTAIKKDLSQLQDLVRHFELVCIMEKRFELF